MMSTKSRAAGQIIQIVAMLVFGVDAGLLHLQEHIPTGAGVFVILTMVMSGAVLLMTTGVLTVDAWDGLSDK